MFYWGISALCQLDLQAFGKRLTIWFSHLVEKKSWLQRQEAEIDLNDLSAEKNVYLCLEPRP